MRILQDKLVWITLTKYLNVRLWPTTAIQTDDLELNQVRLL